MAISTRHLCDQVGRATPCAPQLSVDVRRRATSPNSLRVKTLNRRKTFYVQRSTLNSRWLDRIHAVGMMRRRRKNRWYKGARHLCRFNMDNCLVFAINRSCASRSGVNAALLPRFSRTSTAWIRIRGYTGRQRKVTGTLLSCHFDHGHGVGLQLNRQIPRVGLRRFDRLNLVRLFH